MYGVGYIWFDVISYSLLISSLPTISLWYRCVR